MSYRFAAVNLHVLSLLELKSKNMDPHPHGADMSGRGVWGTENQERG